MAPLGGVGTEILNEAGVGESLADGHLVRVKIGKHRLLAVHPLHCAHRVGRHGVGALGSEKPTGIDLHIDACNRRGICSDSEHAGLAIVRDVLATSRIHRILGTVEVHLDFGYIDGSGGLWCGHGNVHGHIHRLNFDRSRLCNSSDVAVIVLDAHVYFRGSTIEIVCTQKLKLHDMRRIVGIERLWYIGDARYRCRRQLHQ